MSLSASVTSFLPELESLIAEVMDEWKVPGLAIAVVQDGTPVLLKGYGLRDIEAGLKVTPDTQFQIASLSKSFTATGLAVLVDEGHLDWTQPVRKYLPEFQLQDPVATERLTVRDLLCHHSGLPRHDWLWLPGDRSSGQILAAMRHVALSDDIRNRFQYCNLGYVVASLLAERLSGQAWADFTRTRLTDKLAMTLSFTAGDLAAATDNSIAYEQEGDAHRRLKPWPVAATAAGGLNTSVASLANWLRFHMGKGEFEGQRLLSAAQVRELQTPRVHVGGSGFAEVGDIHYGLGFRTHWYRGERVVWHGGGWNGTFAMQRMLPDRGVGVAVLTNSNGAPEILTNYIFDRVCGLEPVPWIDRLRELRRKAIAQYEADQEARKAVPRSTTRPSHALTNYAGDYDHPGYGRITITLADSTLHWAFRGMSEPLTHRQDDTFELPERPESPGGLLPGRLAVSFSANDDGNIASLAVPFDPAVNAIVFTRTHR